MRRIFTLASLTALLLLLVCPLKAADNLYVFHKGNLVFKCLAADVDSVALEDNKTKVTLYNKQHAQLFTAPSAEVDSITFKYYKPVADILDVVFKKDGSAEDISPMKNTIESFGETTTYYNEIYGRYVAKINNTWGGMQENGTYYKVDYSKNEAIKKALADGHTMETLFKATYTGDLEDKEAKWFAGHQAGGTGFLISKKSGERQNEITFLPNVSTNGKSNWIWATSGIVPETEVFYHVIGVWDKDAGKAYIYVNGELKNTVDAKGEFHFPAEAAQWFGIGCDASKKNGEQSGNWEIVTSRIYDRALNQEDVNLLWESVAELQTKPVADLLDVVFNEDGTAKDVSPMKNNVRLIGSSASTYYNNTYKRYVASFNNPWAGTASGYYRIDFESNSKFRTALANGHTLEAVFMASYAPPIANAEAKPFSAHQGGGTGFLISTTSGNRKNEITFLPNVTTTGKSNWRWATSGVIPQPQTYYHVIGVWDKDAKKAYIYVNGELKNTIAADGNFRFAENGSNWFCLGGDASPSGGQNGWCGDIVMARVYDKPLDKQKVAVLWDEVKRLQAGAEPDMVTGLSYYSGMAVKPGGTYSLTGKGFAEGDKIVLVALKSGIEPDTLSTVVRNDTLTMNLPTTLTTGNYRMILVRGDKQQDLGINKYQVVKDIPAGMRVIAHRGFWDKAGSAQNSRSSLQNAFDAKCYGSEIDVWITTDGHVMVNHDATLNGVEIQKSTYAQVKNLKLSNGESIPELKEFLEMLAKEDSTKLIIEIKTHSDERRGIAAVDSAVKQVKDRGLQDKVEYIAFSLNLCRELVKQDPSAHVAYLNGDIAPKTLYEYGIMGLDYTAKSYRNNPSWATDARKLGMTTNVWTINDAATMIEMTNMGIDFVTTNAPLLAQQIEALYNANHTTGGETPEPEPVEKPKADILDIVFNENGTVTDASPMNNEVKVFSSDNKTVPVAYDEVRKAYVASFNNPYGGDAATYARVDYADNEAFKKALANGHTLETIFKVTYEGELPNVEAKWFAGHQAGGTGFLICKTSGERKNEITFLPNVSTNGKSNWIWANSGVVPQSDVFYHVVGVWDKDAGKASVYVNGELKKTVAAEGELHFPAEAAQWFGIGCDANPSKGEQSGNWQIVTERIYGKALTQDEVNLLW